MGMPDIETEGVQEIVMEKYGMYEIRQVKMMCPVQRRDIHIKKIRFETKDGHVEQADIGRIHFRTQTLFC